MTVNVGSLILRDMKSISLKLVVCLIVSSAALITSSCAKPDAEPRMVKAKVFEERFERVGKPETMHVTIFEGIKDGVAILEIHDRHIVRKDWRKERIGAKLENLDPLVRDEVVKAAAEIKADAQLTPAQRAAKQKQLDQERAKQKRAAIQKLLHQQGLNGAGEKQGD